MRKNERNDEINQSKKINLTAKALRRKENSTQRHGDTGDKKGLRFFEEIYAIFSVRFFSLNKTL